MIAAILLSALLLQPAPTYPHRDYRITPGAIATTDVAAICRAGAAGEVRREQPVSTKLRNQVLLSYGIPANTRGYTLDHVVPIELGGAPADARNLFPGEPAQQRQKDKAENALHSAVCQNGLALWKAQACMAVNWHLCVDWFLNERS